MPYIKQKDRLNLDYLLHDVSANIDALNGHPGVLNYTITKLCDEYILSEGKDYATINSVIGVLECAKLELYRRVAAPYEDTKIKENGDVYDA